MAAETVLGDLWCYFGGIFVGAVFTITGVPISKASIERQEAIDKFAAAFAVYWLLFGSPFPFTEEAIGRPYCLIDETVPCFMLVTIAWTWLGAWRPRR